MNNKFIQNVLSPLTSKPKPEVVHFSGILTGVIIIFIYYKAYEYLDGLRSCSCAPKDLSTLKHLEMFFIILTVFFTIVNILKLVSGKTTFIPPGSDFIILTIYLFFMLAIELVYIYNVYIYIYSTNDCGCMNHWQKYILYIQSIFYSLVPILAVFLLLLVGFGPALLFLIIISSLTYYVIGQFSHSANTPTHEHIQ